MYGSDPLRNRSGPRRSGGLWSASRGGSPDVPQHTVLIGISNNHDESHVVRVSTIPPKVEGLEVTYENGSTHRFDVSSFDALPRMD